MARSGACMFAIAASTSRSPSALLLFARSSALRSLARALIAARSSAVNPLAAWVAFVSAIAHLLDPDEVAGRVADGAVATAVRLVGRLLDDLGVTRLHAFEGPVEVGGCQVDAGERALGHH